MPEHCPGEGQNAIGLDRGWGLCYEVRVMSETDEPFDLTEARRQDFIDRCAKLAPGESFTLTWAQFLGSAPVPNLTGCSAAMTGPDSVVVYKPKH